MFTRSWNSSNKRAGSYELDELDDVAGEAAGREGAVAGALRGGVGETGCWEAPLLRRDHIESRNVPRRRRPFSASIDLTDWTAADAREYVGDEGDLGEVGEDAIVAGTVAGLSGELRFVPDRDGSGGAAASDKAFERERADRARDGSGGEAESGFLLPLYCLPDGIVGVRDGSGGVAATLPDGRVAVLVRRGMDGPASPELISLGCKSAGDVMTRCGGVTMLGRRLSLGAVETVIPA